MHALTASLSIVRRPARALLVGALAVAPALTACYEGAAEIEQPRPKAIVMVPPAPASSAVGLALATPPTFVVQDQNGATMAGIAVAVAVTGGGGALVGAPALTSSNGPTPIGTWTLGAAAGPNTLTISSEGVPT